MSQTLYVIMFFLLTNLRVSSQTTMFKGYMVYPDGGRMGYGYVAFPLAKDTVVIDSTGEVNIDMTIPNHRVFFVSNGDIKGKIYRFETEKIPDSIYQISIPDSSFYSYYQSKKMCPICLSSKAVLPIVYGLPGAKLLRSAKKGKVILAGCIIPQYPLYYYCTKDSFDF